MLERIATIRCLHLRLYPVESLEHRLALELLWLRSYCGRGQTLIAHCTRLRSRQ